MKQVKCIDNNHSGLIIINQIYTAKQCKYNKDNYQIDSRSWRKDRFVVIEEEQFFYNVWNTQQNRWTNSKDQNPDCPAKLTLQAAQELFKGLSSLGWFEIRPMLTQPIPPNQKCIKCDKPCPHGIPNQKDNTYICVSCSTLLDLEGS
jgi:hypothetical protein